MEWEWPVYRIVLEAGIPLTEVNRWDLEDIEKAAHLLAMKEDMESAYGSYIEKEIKSDRS